VQFALNPGIAILTALNPGAAISTALALKSSNKYKQHSATQLNNVSNNMVSMQQMQLW